MIEDPYHVLAHLNIVAYRALAAFVAKVCVGTGAVLRDMRNKDSVLVPDFRAAWYLTHSTLKLVGGRGHGPLAERPLHVLAHDHPGREQARPRRAGRIEHTSFGVHVHVEDILRILRTIRSRDPRSRAP